MKPFSIRALLALLAITAVAGPSSVYASDTETKAGSIERDYLVKGMTCGGCVFGVKTALKRAGIDQNQILEVDYKKPDPKNKVGHARVRFAQDQYKGEMTDCRIIKEIRESPGYIAYLDPEDTDPCKLGK